MSEFAPAYEFAIKHEVLRYHQPGEVMIEVKRPPYMSGKRRIPEGKPTQIQLETLLKLHKQGALVLVAWSCQDVLEALNG